MVRNQPIYDVDPETGDLIGIVGRKGEHIPFRKGLGKFNPKKAGALLLSLGLSGYVATLGAGVAASFQANHGMHHVLHMARLDRENRKALEEIRKPTKALNRHVLNELGPRFALNTKQRNAIQELCDKNSIPITRLFDVARLLPGKNLDAELQRHSEMELTDREDYQRYATIQMLRNNLHDENLASALRQIIEKQKNNGHVIIGSNIYNNMSLSEELADKIPGFHSVEGDVQRGWNTVSTNLKYMLYEQRELDAATSRVRILSTIAQPTDKETINRFVRLTKSFRDKLVIPLPRVEIAKKPTFYDKTTTWKVEMRK
ncbi:hypothetical protein HUU53_03825 [Candidatus Micrarchaeota archaeon]|nr:hypothetical protein [Candidatus Micrarchaeota archaeon]